MNVQWSQYLLVNAYIVFVVKSRFLMLNKRIHLQNHANSIRFLPISLFCGIRTLTVASAFCTLGSLFRMFESPFFMCKIIWNPLHFAMSDGEIMSFPLLRSLFLMVWSRVFHPNWHLGGAASHLLPAWWPRRKHLPDADAEASAEQAILEKLEDVESRVKRGVFLGLRHQKRRGQSK